MKIIQFTDPHIGGIDQDTHGIDTRANFISTLDAIRLEDADVVVLTGDLCFKEPRRDAYFWIKEKLDEYGIDALITPGNHDDTVMMCEVMDLTPSGDELYFKREWGDTEVLFLDSSKAAMSEAQWQWFDNNLDRDGRMIIFTHYPPIKCFVPYMDGKHSFNQREKFLKLTSSYNGNVHLFCGHYHVDKSVSVGNLHVHITPSGFFQIRDDMEDFGIDHYRVGYRVIRVEDGVLAHEVRYL